jgi:hypothetical protein
VDSHKEHPAGINHEFIKGFGQNSNLELARAEFSEIPHLELQITDDHFDIGVYLYVTTKIEADYVCFLNTHTQILAHNWLSHLRLPMNDSYVGLGYPPRWWPHGETFRQGNQANLLVADDQTPNFDEFVSPEKQEFAYRSWGPYLQEANAVRKR